MLWGGFCNKLCSFQMFLVWKINGKDNIAREDAQIEGVLA